jgi:hypothetical protein
VKIFALALALIISLGSIPARADGLFWFLVGSSVVSHNSKTVTEYKDKTSLEIDSIQDRIEKDRYEAHSDSIVWDLTGFEENRQALVSHFKNQGFKVKLQNQNLIIETGYFTAQKENSASVAKIMAEHKRAAKRALTWLLYVYLALCVLIGIKELIWPSNLMSQELNKAIKSTWGHLRAHQKKDDKNKK